MQDRELRREYKEWSESIREIFEKIKEVMDKKVKSEDLVECEVCGCLLKKETAVKGESKIVIEHDVDFHNGFDFNGFLFGKERIIHTYYCKLHNPNIFPPKEVKKTK